MAGQRPQTPLLALAACLALAGLSLLAPFAPLYDPWSWLVWGRELVALELDTGAGPSWKPLPVLICAALAPAGGAAPDLWLLVARAAWLAVPVLAWRLAARLEGEGGPAAAGAGLLAAAGVVLLHDGVTSSARQLTGGLAEPLLVALVLGAVEAALARRGRLALGLAAAACLVRPEAWPFAALYGLWLARAGAVGVPVLAGGSALVLALWLVPDLLAAGDAFEGAGRARGGGSPGAALETLARALAMPLALLWAGVALAAAEALRERGAERSRAVLALAAGVLAWIGLVAAMAAAGWAGLPRFMAPAAALVCALGAAGLVRAAPRAPRWALVLACLALAADAGWRAAAVPGELDRARREAAATNELRALAASNRERLLACPPLATSDFRGQPPLAWELDLQLGAVAVTTRYPHRGTLVVGPDASAGLRVVARLAGERLTPAAPWEAHRAGPCEGGGPHRASGAPIAGVSGATR